MKIGIISDTHDNIPNIKKSLGVFKEQNVEVIIHAGDFVAPFSIWPFAEAGIKFISVFGNNDGEKEGLKLTIEKFGGEIYESPYVFELAGKKFLLTHILPTEPDAFALKYNPNYFIYAHDHISKIEKRDNYLMINPGECGGWLYGDSTVVILDTETDDCRIIELTKGEGLKSQ